jgi:hypothetical protein
MSTYNPAILGLSNGDPFNGAQVDAAFDDLSNAINGNVDDTSNIVDNNILPFNKFHAGAVTETWTASSRGQGNESFLVVMEDSTATSSPYGAGQNYYDVPDTGVDFYLRENATVRFEGCCELLKAKDTWNRPVAHYPTSWNAGATPVVLGYSFTVSLVVDKGAGTGIKRFAVWSYVPDKNGILSFEQRGFPMDITFTLAGLSAGKHTAFLRLTVQPNWDDPNWKVAGNQFPIVSQFISTSRMLSVHAIYR